MKDHIFFSVTAEVKNRQVKGLESRAGSNRHFLEYLTYLWVLSKSKKDLCLSSRGTGKGTVSSHKNMVKEYITEKAEWELGLTKHGEATRPIYSAAPISTGS